MEVDGLLLLVAVASAYCCGCGLLYGLSEAGPGLVPPAEDAGVVAAGFTLLLFKLPLPPHSSCIVYQQQGFLNLQINFIWVECGHPLGTGVTDPGNVCHCCASGTDTPTLALHSLR